MTSQDLQDLIEKEAAKRRLSVATLCKKAVNNHRLYRNLKAGRSCTLDVAERLVRYIDETPVKQDTAA